MSDGPGFTEPRYCSKLPACYHDSGVPD